MERRFIFATFLSIMLLWSWSALTQHPAVQSNVSISTQHIDNKDLAIIKNNISEPELAHSLSVSASPVEEKIEVIETSKLILEFTDRGGALNKIGLKEFGSVFPVKDIAGQQGVDVRMFHREMVGEREISYTYMDGDLFIRKKYNVAKDDYTISIEVQIQNKSDMSKLIEFTGRGFSLDMSTLDKSTHDYSVERSLFEYIIALPGNISRKNNAYAFTIKEKKEYFGEVSWIGFRNRYFCLIVKPQYKVEKSLIDPARNDLLNIDIIADKINLAAGSSQSFSYFVYAGPENPDLLKKYNMNFEDIQRYYRIPLFDVVAKIIYGSLNTFHKFLHNWGVSILLISTLIYLCMYPLTLRSMLSMKKMQSVQPKIVALREKYKDNPSKLNLELLDIYKKNKINPLGGCLPMLLQMPVFIGLYQVLWRSVSLKGAQFLWIKDLSQPDRFVIISFNLPFIGNEINLLPIIMVFVMAAQQWLTSKSMVITDPAQETQQKIMLVLMPIIMGVVFYQFPSGLTLYFTLFYAFSTIAQWKMSRLPSQA